jgi:hypothetical protein
VSVRSVLQKFAHLTGKAFCVLPRDKRFAAARRIALMIAPLLRRSRYFPRRPSLLDGPREEALRMVLRSMTRARVLFNPDIEVRGYEHLADRPVLIVSAHFLLNVTMSRLILESGRRFVACLAGPREPMYYLGTETPLHHIFVTPRLFVQLRQTLGDGHVAFLIPEVMDTPPDSTDDWRVVDTVVGPRHVSPAVFAFASRTRTPVVFGATYLNPEGRLTITYEQPQAQDSEGLRDEYCRFLQKHAAAVIR